MLFFLYISVYIINNSSAGNRGLFDVKRNERKRTDKSLLQLSLRDFCYTANLMMKSSVYFYVGVFKDSFKEDCSMP
ncbi:hypothetical protein XENTR_v10021740 [Xenopus tropicalis]|nr:hypothetical protein XENTR_v10021740 [Xenopus tropicalis]